MKRAPRWSSVHAPISDNGVKDLVKSGWVWGEEGEHPVKERRQCDEAKTRWVGGATPATRGNKTVQVEKTNGAAAGII